MMKSHPLWRACKGWALYRNSQRVDKQKEYLSITALMALTETRKPWEKKEHKRRRSLAPACSQFTLEESSNNISGGHACFTGSFKGVYGMIFVEWLYWKQLRLCCYRRMVVFFFQLHLDTSYHYISARNEAQQLFAIYWSLWQSNEEE